MNLKNSFKSRIQDPRRQRAIQIRSQVEEGIRLFFKERGFLETRTPLLARSPGMEVHIRPFQVLSHARTDVKKSYLPTSPEFAMKKLLAGGLSKIFQICPAFRDEPSSQTHSPEFTMLEWYRANAGYQDIMKDTESLFESLAIRQFGKPEIPYQGKTISVKTPWPRFKIRDLFLEQAQVDLVKCNSAALLAGECKRLGISSNPSQDTWDDLFFRIWLNLIEPKLPSNQAVFVYRYPPSQAALAVIDEDSDKTKWAKRFEVFAGGLELGNAFEELTDPSEQRFRFERDMKERAQIYGEAFPSSPIDEDFLAALHEGMPPSGGIAMGVDRIVMLFADETDIDYTFWLSACLA